jgi:hypothetical protein
MKTSRKCYSLFFLQVLSHLSDKSFLFSPPPCVGQEEEEEKKKKKKKTKKKKKLHQFSHVRLVKRPIYKRVWNSGV